MSTYFFPISNNTFLISLLTTDYFAHIKSHPSAMVKWDLRLNVTHLIISCIIMHVLHLISFHFLTMPLPGFEHMVLTGRILLQPTNSYKNLEHVVILMAFSLSKDMQIQQ